MRLKKVLALTCTVLFVALCASAHAEFSAIVNPILAENGAITSLDVTLSGFATPVEIGSRVAIELPSYYKVDRYAPTICTMPAASVATTTQTMGNTIEVTFLVSPGSPSQLNFMCTNIGNPDTVPSTHKATTVKFYGGTSQTPSEVSVNLPHIYIPNIAFGRKLRRVIIPNNQVNRVNDISFQFEKLGDSLTHISELLATGRTLTVYLPGEYEADAGDATRCRVGTLNGESHVSRTTIGEKEYLALGFTPRFITMSTVSRITMTCTNIRVPQTAQAARNDIRATLTSSTVAPNNVEINNVALPAIIDDSKAFQAHNLDLLFFTYSGSNSSGPSVSFHVPNFVWPFMDNDLVGLFFPDGVSLWPDVNCTATYMGTPLEPYIQFATDSAVIFNITAGLGTTPSGSISSNFPSIGDIADFNIQCKGVGPDIDFDWETTQPFTTSLRAIRSVSRTLRDYIDPNNNPIINALRDLEIVEFVRETRLYEWASDLDFGSPLRFMRSFAEFGRDVIEDFVDAMRELGRDIVEIGQDLGGDFVDAGEQVGGDLIEAGQDVVGDIVDAGQQVGGDIVDAGEQVIGDLVDAGQQVVDEIKDVGGEIIDAGEQVVGDIVDAGQQIGSDIVDAGEQVVGDLVDAGEQVVEEIKDAAGQVQDALEDGYDAVTGAIGDAYDAAKDVVGDAYDAAQDVAGTTADGVQEVGGAIVDGAQGVGQAVVDGAETVGGAVVDAAEDVAEAVRDGVEGVVDAATFKAKKVAKRAMKTQQKMKPQQKKTKPQKMGPHVTQKPAMRVAAKAPETKSLQARKKVMPKRAKNAKLPALTPEQRDYLKKRGQAFRARAAQKFAAMLNGEPFKSKAHRRMATYKRVTKMNIIEDVADGISSGIGTGANLTSSFIRGTADFLSDGIGLIPDLADRARDLFGNFFDPFSDDFLTFLDITRDAAQRFRDELRSLQFLARASDQLEQIVMDLFNIDEWPDVFDEALDAFNDLRADFREAFMDISLPSSIENSWRRLVNASRDVYNEIRHSIGRIGSVGDLIVEIRDVIGDIPASSFITVPLGALYDVTDFTLCSVNKVATTFLREAHGLTETILRVRIPSRISDSEITIECSDVTVISSTPLSGFSLTTPISLITSNGDTSSLGNILPVDILPTAELGTSNRQLTHSSDTTYTTGSLTLTLSPIGAAANKLKITLPSGYLTANAGDSTQCQAAVNGVPVIGTSTSATSTSITVSAATLVAAAVADTVDAVLEVVCSNVRRARFVHNQLEDITIEAFMGDSLVGKTTTATLSAVTQPNPMAGTTVTLTASSILANAEVSIVGEISRIPFDILAGDRLTLAIPSPWIVPTDGSVTCTVEKKDGSSVPLTGSTYIASQEVTVRVASDIAMSSGNPLKIMCSGIRNPAHTLETSSASGIFFGVKDADSRQVMATTNGITSNYSDGASSFGAGTALIPLTAAFMDDIATPISSAMSGVAIRFSSPIPTSVNDIIEVILPDGWTTSSGTSISCSLDGVSSQLAQIVERDGLEVLHIALPVAQTAIFVVQTIICTSIRITSTPVNAVLGLISSGRTAVQSNVEVINNAFAETTRELTHSVGTANSVGNVVVRIAGFPLDMILLSKVIFELPEGWRVNANGLTSCTVSQVNNASPIIGTTTATENGVVRFTIGTGKIKAGNDEVTLTCSNIAAPNVATPQRSDVHIRIVDVSGIRIGERNDATISEVTFADLTGKVTLTSTSVLAGSLTDLSFRISPAVVDVLKNDVVAFSLPNTYSARTDVDAVPRTLCTYTKGSVTISANADVDSDPTRTTIRVTIPKLVSGSETFTIRCTNVRNPIVAQAQESVPVTIYEKDTTNIRARGNDAATPSIAANAFGQDLLYLIPGSTNVGQTTTLLMVVRPFSSSEVNGKTLRIGLPTDWTPIVGGSPPFQCTPKVNGVDIAGGTTTRVGSEIRYTFATNIDNNVPFRIYCSPIQTPTSPRALSNDISVGVYTGETLNDSSSSGVLAPVVSYPSSYVAQMTVRIPMSRSLTRREAVRIGNSVTNLFAPLVERAEVFRQQMSQNVVQNQNILSVTVNVFPASGTSLDKLLIALIDQTPQILPRVAQITGTATDAVSADQPLIYAYPDSCSNGLTDEDETGRDCGGARCNQCLGTESCLNPSDCGSGICVSGRCQAVSAAPGTSPMIYYVSLLIAPLLAAIIAYISSN